MNRENIKKLLKNKTAIVIFVCIAALVLLIAVWKVFFGSTELASHQTEEEIRLCNLLEKIEGVNNPAVMISKSDGEITGAVVVFDGADSILTRMRVLDVTTVALSIGKGNIQVYPSGN